MKPIFFLHVSVHPGIAEAWTCTEGLVRRRRHPGQRWAQRLGSPAALARPCMHTCLCIHYTCMYTHIHLSLSLYIYIYLHIYIYIYTHMYIYIYTLGLGFPEAPEASAGVGSKACYNNSYY